MKAIYRLSALAAFFVPVLFYQDSRAQSDVELLAEKLRQDPALAEAIALYPAEIRRAVLEAARYPQVLVKMAGIQEKSSAAFARLVERFPPDEQEQLWDLVRFPGLIDELVAGGKKNKVEIEAILEEYPREIRQTARALGRERFDVLAEIHRLNRSTETAFARLVDGHPPAVRQSFRDLLQVPEVLLLLNEDMATTILLGEAYEEEPRQVEERLTALNLDLARRHARTARAGGQGAEREESLDFSAIYDYDTGAIPETRARYGADAEIYDYDAGLLEGPEPSQETTVVYYERPYPYWFGYPYWHAGARLSWYITPHISASLSWYPRAYRRTHVIYRPHAGTRPNRKAQVTYRPHAGTRPNRKAQVTYRPHAGGNKRQAKRSRW